MMKFAVFSKVKLIKKPSWLNKFEKDYLENSWHITLKQPCCIEAKKVQDIKNKLKEASEKIKIKNKIINIKFDKLIVAKEKSNGRKTIMICPADNKEICKLQKKIVSALKGYSNYCEEENKIWEKHFNPHLTIASNLDRKEFLKAKKYIKENHFCEGIIDGFTLVYAKYNVKKINIDYNLNKN